MSNNKENERAELHKIIWRIASDLRGRSRCQSYYFSISVVMPVLAESETIQAHHISEAIQCRIFDRQLWVLNSGLPEWISFQNADMFPRCSRSPSRIMRSTIERVGP